MPTRRPLPSVTGPRVHLRPPSPADEAAFLRAARASRRLHGAWANPPSTALRFAAFVERYDGRNAAHAGFLVVRKTGPTPPGFPRRPGVARKRPLA